MMSTLRKIQFHKRASKRRKKNNFSIFDRVLQRILYQYFILSQTAHRQANFKIHQQSKKRNRLKNFLIGNFSVHTILKNEK